MMSFWKSRITDFFCSFKRKKKSEVKPELFGSKGLLEIQDLGIKVPLYDTSVGPAQTIVDAENSAVYLRWGNGQIAIADHANQQNFSNLEKAIPGRTIAHIRTYDSDKEFICYQVQVGHIKTSASGNSIFDADGNPVFWQNPGGITIYTCIRRSASDVMDIRLTYWHPKQ